MTSSMSGQLFRTSFLGFDILLNQDLTTVITSIKSQCDHYMSDINCV